MAIGFRAITQAASGGTSGTSTISAPALPAGTASGDMVVLVVGFKYGDAITMTAPTDWTVVSDNEAANSGLTNSGNDAGNVRGAVFFRQYDGVWTMPSITTSGNYNVSMRGVISYTKAAGEAWVDPVCANAVDNTTSSVGLDPAASGTTIPITTGDYTGSVGFQNGDAGTFSSHNIAVTGITFGAQSTRLGAASTVGTDMRIHSIDRLYTSGTASAGPDGSVVMTGGGGSDAGVMVFYRLRVAPRVDAVLAAPLGALVGTVVATPEHPAVLAGAMGSLSGTAAASVKHFAVLAAPLGVLSGTAAAVAEHPAVLAAALGALNGTAAATVEHPATLAGPLGALTATAIASASSGTTTVPAVLSAPLGALTAAATATVEHPVTAVAACGGLAATATATVRRGAVGTAPLGGLTATAAATATTPPVITAVLVANLGALVAMANAGPPPPPPPKVGFDRFGVSDWPEVVAWVGYLNEQGADW